jgi:hypothetical protein
MATNYPPKNVFWPIKSSKVFQTNMLIFLLTQNGFSFKPYDEDTDVCAEYAKHSAESDNHSEGNSDLSVLYGFDSGDEYYYLEDNQQGLEIFKGVFSP